MNRNNTRIELLANMSKVDKYKLFMNNMSILPTIKIKECVCNAIINMNPNRELIIHAAYNLGLDLNSIIIEENYLFEYTIKINDIVSLLALIKCNIDMDRMKYGKFPILHTCIIFNNIHLFKYFIKEGQDINSIDFINNTALHYAIRPNSFEYAKILLDKGADFDTKNSNNNTVFDCICSSIIFNPLGIYENKNYRNDILEIFKKIIILKKNITKEEIFKIYFVFMQKPTTDIHINIFQILLKRYPNIIYKKIDENKNNFVHLSIMNKNDLLVDLFLNKKINIFKKNNIDETIFHLLFNYGYDKYAEHFLQLYPDIVNIIPASNYTILQYIILPYHNYIIHEETIMKKTEKDILNFIEIIKNYDIKINQRNIYGERAIELAIRYGSINIVNKVIELGYKLNENRIKNRVYPAHNNNDILSFCVQLGKFEIFKHLINIGAPLHMYHIFKNNEFIIPSSLIMAIICGRDIFITYLLNLVEIKNCLKNPKVRNYLVELFINFGYYNKKILQQLILKEENQKYPNNFYKKIRNYQKNNKLKIYKNKMIKFQNENFNEVDILISTYIMLNIFVVIYNDKKGDCSTVLENLIDKMMDIIGSKNIYISHIFNIITDFIDFYNFYELGYCINIINDPINLHNKEYFKKQLFAFHKLDMFNKINKIYDTINIIDSLLRCYGFNINSNINLDLNFDMYDGNNHIDYDTGSESEINICEKNFDFYDNDLNMTMDSIHTILNGFNKPKKIITQTNIDTNNIDNDVNNIDLFNKDLINKSDTNLFNILFIDENFYDIDETQDNINILNNKNKFCKPIKSNNLRKFKLSKYDIYHIDKSLRNLRYPIMLENHDIIKNLLHKTNLYTKSSEKITIYDDYHKIITVVYPMKNTTDNFTISKISSKKRPTQWIKSYAPNICGEGKRDTYHMFPFILDLLLRKWSCIENNSIDKINPGKRIFYYYFLGEIIIKDKIIKGCFEYFINNNGSLFHRLFKKIDNVPQKIINEIFN
ncbi:ankyrin repeat protein [Megavirus baoshan]|uniref:Ankyrin repeat protein n=1 Tax=Megavirus baoshan TaxID=2496520 RepID=A0A3S8UZ58_9VIRU|nr:ankyrin repeat protein [Megavirus baoshan]AZL90013.1 ankyrin repeat protein [Megavirus baoshan]